MLNIIKKIKNKINEKIEEYATKNISELSRLISRPIEGEIVKMSNIKIKKNFKRPQKTKLNQRRKYYNKYKYFRSTIILDNKNYLIDGYTTYLLAKEFNFDYITILRNK